MGLSEAAVGIAGAGSIGLEVARIVAPLAAKVLVWSQRGRTLDLPAGCETVASLDDLALRADAVTVHLALTETTRGVIGKAFFDMVKANDRRIALVNTSRGSIVDEPALLEALESGAVRSAAIDVWSSEGAKDSDIVRTLRRHPSVLPTSHIGAFTTGVQQLYATQVARNIIAVSQGRLDEIAEHLVKPD
jgi:D-3-phosphoglycerate dehydrogenase